MKDLLNLEQYPLDQPESEAYGKLVEHCQSELASEGMFNLEGLVKPEVLAKTVSELSPKMASESFTHQRSHNIYFKKQVPGLNPDHPALAEVKTTNHTLCADQISGSDILTIYEWPPLANFLAEVMEKETLYTMPDPLARLNIMAYHEGEALNWHFDRSEFTVTLLLQAPKAGGEFEYRTDLRTSDDPNYEGVAKLLRDQDPEKRSITPTPGTLNVFRGVNTPHRVTPIKGDRERMIAVLSYYDQPGVMFTDEERIGFFGRAS